MIFILTTHLVAAPISLNGKLSLANLKWKEKTPPFSVSLKNNPVSTVSDTAGNFYLGGQTETISPVKKTNHFVELQKGFLTLRLVKAEKVDIALYSLSGREMYRISDILPAGAQKIASFNSLIPTLSDSYYILKLKMGDSEQVIKYSPIVSQSLNFKTTEVVSNRQNRSSAVDTLEIKYNDQLVGLVPITKFEDTLKSIPIYKMHIASSFLDTFDYDAEHGTHYLKANAYGMEHLFKDSIALDFDPSDNSFSCDTLYVHLPDSIHRYNVRVFCTDKNGIKGKSFMGSFSLFHPSVSINSFYSKNSLAKSSLTGDTLIFVGGRGKYGINNNNPFFSAVKYEIDDPRTLGIDVVSDKYVQATFSFDSAETVEFKSILTDTAGNTDTARIVVTAKSQNIEWDGIGEKPITLVELKELANTPNFYNPDYRPEHHDSLGSQYGKLSGGFFDTFEGETQFQMAHPISKFTIRDGEFNFKNENLHNGKFLAALALGQEYFNFDLQYAMSTAMELELVGIRDDSLNCAETFWTHEKSNYLTAASTYPELFPTHHDRLINLTSSEASEMLDEIKNYYMGSDYLHLYSPHIINGLIIEYLNVCSYYDMFQYSSKIKFRDFLENSTYPDGAIRAMEPVKLWGMYSQYMDSVANRLSSSEWQQTSMDKSRFDSFMEKAIYYEDIYRIIENWVESSKQSITNPSIQLIDTTFSNTVIFELFLGKWNSFDQISEGGLQLHFNLSETEKKEIRYILEQAYEILKGRAPSTSNGKNISLRYDFLSIARCVKHYFQFKRKAPQGLYIPPVIEKYSE